MAMCPICNEDHEQLPDAKMIDVIFMDGKQGFWRQIYIYHASCPATGQPLVIRDVHTGGNFRLPERRVELIARATGETVVQVGREQ